MNDDSPDRSLLDTVAHAARLNEQSRKLNRLRRDAMEVAAGLARRATVEGIQAAIDLSRDRDVPGRQPLIDAHRAALVNSGPRSKDRGTHRQWPTGPVVYLLWEIDRLHYIGSTIGLANRMTGHSKKPWTHCEWIPCETIAEARQLEADLIFQHQPEANITGRGRRLRIA